MLSKVVGVGSLLALPAALASRLHLGSRKLSWVGWMLLSLACIGGMYGIVGTHFEHDGMLRNSLSFVLIPLCVVGAGMAIPVAHVLAALASRGRWTGVIALVPGLVGLVGNQFLIADDYPGVHAACAWVSAVLAGGAFAPWLASKLERRIVPWLAVLAVLAAVAILWVPSDTVRVLLLRPPGSVVSWVLSRTVWTSPPLIVPLPSSVPAPRHDLRPARHYAANPVVVLMTVEALRGDLLATGSYDRDLPNLVSIRDSGAYFPRASSASSQTAISITTLFTGRHFSQMRWEPSTRSKLRAYFPTLDPAVRFPTLLNAASIDTKSYVGINFLSAEYGTAAGFADQNVMVRTRSMPLRATSWGRCLRSCARPGRCAFFYAHLTEPHEPYDRGRVTEGTDFERYVSEVAVVDEWVGRWSNYCVRAFRTAATSFHGRPRRGFQQARYLFPQQDSLPRDDPRTLDHLGTESGASGGS